MTAKEEEEEDAVGEDFWPWMAAQPTTGLRSNAFYIHHPYGKGSGEMQEDGKSKKKGLNR